MKILIQEPKSGMPSQEAAPNGGLKLACSERGSSLVEFALIIPVLSLLLLGAIDFGRAYYLGIEVSNAARAGAQYGAGNPTDTAGMQTAANKDAPDVSGGLTFSPTPAWGCECSDGTSQQASCAPVPTCVNNVVKYVQVNTSATYTTLIPWPFIPSSIPMSGQATIRVAQ